MLDRIVRLKFSLTSRARARGWIEYAARQYDAMLAEVPEARWSEPVNVPKMLGVDEDMRDWSLAQLHEHNAIVNEQMCAVVAHLAGDGPPPGPFNAKTDTLPSADAGVDQIERFRTSVRDYLATEAPLPRLRGGRRAPHVLFGPFDAHKWHCMLGFHLKLHLKQSARIVEGLKASA